MREHADDNKIAATGHKFRSGLGAQCVANFALAGSIYPA